MFLLLSVWGCSGPDFPALVSVASAVAAACHAATVASSAEPWLVWGSDGGAAALPAASAAVDAAVCISAASLTVVASEAPVASAGPGSAWAVTAAAAVAAFDKVAVAVVVVV